MGCCLVVSMAAGLEQLMEEQMVVMMASLLVLKTAVNLVDGRACWSDAISAGSLDRRTV